METPQQQRRPTVGQFAKALADAKLDCDAIDLADMLWLAQFIEAAEIEPAAVDPASEPQTPDPPPSQTRNPVDASDRPIETTALNLYAADPPPVDRTSTPEQTPATPPGIPFSVPAAPALRTRLDLARSLRPLMRKLPSQTRFDLDEEATVSQIAETEVWMPVVRPLQERWLELDLVVEASKTTVIWEQAIAELHHLAEYQGAFRAVRTWRLSAAATSAATTSATTTVQLFPRWRDGITQAVQPEATANQRPHTPRELLDPTGRRLIWLVTDCTSLLWRQDQIYETLLDWTTVQPIAIVQLFPERLWSRTALRNGHIVRLSALAPGLPSKRLEIEGLPQRLERRSSAELVTVPIVTLEPVSMIRWARVTAGAGDVHTPGRTFDLSFIRRQAEKANAARPARPPAASAQERVALFRATASKTAQQLASLMAATPVSLPVIDLLRESFRADFAEEVQQSYVAEVLLSGLLRRCDSDDDAICRYEFWGDGSPNPTDRVRDILLGDASVTKTVEVLNVLTAAIYRKLGSPTKSFQALLADLQSGAIELQGAALPFARVGLDVLRRLGGEYAAIAQRYDLNPDAQRPDPRQDIDFPLQDLEYEVAKLIDFPPLQPCEYESATITAILDRFDFETATLAQENRLLGLRRDWVIRRRRTAAWGYREPLSSDPDIAIDLEMIAIPGGTFLMGAPEQEPESQDNERPQHPVTLQPFYLGRYPITQAQWRVVAGYERITRNLNLDPSHFKGDNRPVERVSWEDAQEFCQRLSAKTGKEYRLPSEAQWEYACRAGTTTPFHFGETITPELANYDSNYTYGNGPKGEDRQGTTEVGLFPANEWGLHDMHGNVLEWCEDDWHSTYEGAPEDGSAWVEDDRTDTDRVLRGGSWGNDPGYCRSAYHRYTSRGLLLNSVGFRVCCMLPQYSPLLSNNARGLLQAPTGSILGMNI